MRVEIEIHDALWRNAVKHGVCGGLDEVVKMYLRESVFVARAVEQAELAGVGNLGQRWAATTAHQEWDRKYPKIRA